jgi:acyl CoA:acetate/3-ketoacid CoA transferase alpha subunit
MKNGKEVRKFLKDGDTVSMNGFTSGGVSGGARIGFGQVSGTVLPTGMLEANIA